MAGQTVVIAFFFLFGMIVGSFLNVCITRIPEEISIVSPGSRCPRCGTPIKPYDNVPVFAWLWLRGKCRACCAPISAMYPLIELASGLLFVAAFLEFGISQAAVKWLFFTCLILILMVTDLRVRLLPDVVNWPGFAAGLMFSAFVPPDHGIAAILAGRFLQVRLPGLAAGILDGILGAAFGSFLLWGLAAGYKALRGHEGMGLGDVKMIAMIGAFLGLRGTFLTLLVGSLLGGRDWPRRGIVPRGLEEWSSKTREPPRTGDRAALAVGDCEAIPVAAGHVSGDWGIGDRVWRTGDHGAVADV